MTDETSLAFAPLERRAQQAQHGENPLDRISVRDHIVDVEIGAFQVERDTTQRLRFSVVVEVASGQGPHSDDVDDILSYDSVTDAINDALGAARLNLLETLAERIAERILTYPQPQKVFVRIEKLDRGPGKLGVEIVRSRTTSHREEDLETRQKVAVVCLDPEKYSDQELVGFFDRLDADERSFILCVDAGRTGRTGDTGDTGGDLAEGLGENHTIKRHIDLLRIEQKAWRLSAISARCAVVATRTELEWGVKNRQISIWAPSKLVVDAVDGPSRADPRELAVWLAHSLMAGMAAGMTTCMMACELIYLDDNSAVETSLPTRFLSLREAP